MPLSAAQLCIHISATGSTKSPRSRRSYNVSQEAVRQALYILLQRPRSAGRRATDEFGAHSLEELVGVYAREYSDWENLKARQIMAELNLRFARNNHLPACRMVRILGAPFSRWGRKPLQT